MNKMLIKFKDKIAERGRFSGPAISDVRSQTLSFSTYRWVLVIVAIVAVYYAVFASDRYVTVASVYVKSADSGGATGASQLALLTGGAANETKDALLAQAYINSNDMLEHLEETIQVSSHFSSDEWDFYSRLSGAASNVDRLSYFRDAVSTSMNTDTGILTIRGQGYTKEFSYDLVKAMVEESERFINNVSQNIALQEIGFVEKEITRAQARVAEAQDRFLKFQNENGMLSAEAAGASLQGAIIEMENQIIQAQTEEKILSSYLNNDAAQLVTVKAKIAALNEQLAIEKAKLASQDTVTLNDKAADYKRLELELQFATEIYSTALISMEKARIESYRKLKHLVVVQAPQMPDTAILPRKFYTVFSLFVVLTLAYGVLTMILATIREHRDV